MDGWFVHQPLNIFNIFISASHTNARLKKQGPTYYYVRSRMTHLILNYNILHTKDK